ncbi:hypothetical protein [Actinomadura sp. 7K534]|uniref:hypothetical protein n=1 Tax=Actinomadura sp. 7K534 TaxID=2530366 RepID=UPI00104E27B1|nr:hypothetical protein [Actinomadura sp. 7K534]TDB87061.1 hypothetical protein E1266_33275 [Actinomadura sp. 7K534]
MKIRLAWGVVASGLAAWADRPSGPVRLPGGADARPGEPVALGPEDAAEADAARAVAELARLVRAGGAVAAGAGVDLGAGFRSARLDGARGDQRDAVLAALRVLGFREAGRLGDRGGFLVALFGPTVTRRVGAGAARAVEEGRWAALHLAVAASDVLGPEQLERVLALEIPRLDADIVPGDLPSVLGEHLRQVLAPVPRHRRLDLILDLWARVLEHHAGIARRKRRLATQSGRDRVPRLRERRRHHDDEEILGMLRTSLGLAQNPSLAVAARWTPDERYWRDRLDRIVQDALGATALLRTATAVADHGLDDGLDRTASLLRAAAAQVSDTVAAHSARRVPGLTGIPARPAPHVRDLCRRLSGDAPSDAGFAAYVRPRLTSARAYALVIIVEIEVIMIEMLGYRDATLREWAATGLRDWREAAGYERPPGDWAGIPPWSDPLLDGTAPLHARLTAADDPAAVERVGDLLWYADLLDALARLHGHDRARALPGTGAPWFDHDPEPVSEPLAPRLDSVTLAVSGAAQLTALGGVPPRGARTWSGLTEGLMSGTAVAEALTGDFAVPAPLLARDGLAVPGAGVRARVARSARDLADWADYMGNCIAGPGYVDEAREGRTGLLGFYDGHGLLAVNAEVSPLRPASRGWRVSEIAARFNNDPDPALERRIRDWVAAIPGAVAEEPVPAPDEPPPARPVRRRAAPRLVEDAGPPLGTLAGRAWDETAPGALGAYAAVAATPPDAALVRLRRLGAAQLTSAVRRALDSGAVDLIGLWAATQARPLETALDALDPALRDRFDRLGLLLGEPPLPKTLRRLIKIPVIAGAYNLDLAGRRTRRAIGRLAVQDDPVIARALAHRATEPLLCALVVTVSCEAAGFEAVPVTAPRKTKVPGYPATTLDDEDGPWRRALPAARELGADTAVFWDEVAAHGLRVPASWLASGGWPALWSRAHAHRTVTGGGRP